MHGAAEKTGLIGPGHPLNRWLPAVVFCLACLLYLKADFFISWDLARYLDMAQGLLDGKGLVYIDGAPLTERHLFVLFLAGVLFVSKGSVLACTVAVSVMAAGLPVLATALARRMFGIKAAWAAAALMLFSPAVIFWAPRHIDAFWPQPLLACLIILAAAAGPGELKRGLAAGILAGSALLCKEVAVLFAMVPLLARLFRLAPGGWRRVAGFYLGFAPLLVLFLWLLLQGGAANQNPLAYADNGIANLFKVGLAGLARLVGVMEGNRLADTFGLAWVLFAAVLLTPPALFITGRRAEAGNAGLLVLCFVCFLPAWIFSAYYSYRHAQNLLGLAIMFILLGALLAWLAERLASKLIPPSRASAASLLILAALTTGGLVWQTINDVTPPRGGYENSVIKITLHRPGLTLRGGTLYAWLKNNNAPPGKVMVDYPPVRYGLGFYGGGSYQPVHLPLYALVPIARGFHPSGLNALAGRHDGSVLIFCGQLRPSAMAESKIFFLFADELWSRMQSSGAGFLAVYQKDQKHAVAAWASARPGLTLQAEIPWDRARRKLHLYSFRPASIQPTRRPTPLVLVNRQAAVYLRWLSKERPRAWPPIRRDMLKSVTALTPQMLDALLDDRRAPGLKVI